jgi:hypothetical protein
VSGPGGVAFKGRVVRRENLPMTLVKHHFYALQGTKRSGLHREDAKKQGKEKKHTKIHGRNSGRRKERISDKGVC